MENNTEHRKARIYFNGESVPVLVRKESAHDYALLLDWDKVLDETVNAEEARRKREQYIDALYGYEGAHNTYGNASIHTQVLYLHKNLTYATLVYDDPEPETTEQENEPEVDNVVPFSVVPRLTEVERQLALMADLGYKVKSWDINFPEDGEPQLYATFTKEVDN